VILGVRPSEFILLEFQSPSRRIFIDSHSLHLSGRLIGPSIDRGSSLNIIFTETLWKMDFDFNKMTACDEPFYGVVPGKAAYPIGRVCLPVTFGTKENFRTEYLTFEVANIHSSYHAILGRPMLAKFMAIRHHTYHIMNTTRNLMVYDGKFPHESSKFRHKLTSMTKFENVMY
jgi:hypothetical protein